MKGVLCRVETVAIYVLSSYAVSELEQQTKVDVWCGEDRPAELSVALRTLIFARSPTYGVRACHNDADGA